MVVEYEVVVAKALNGPPRIGLVDASISLSEADCESGRVAWDLSQKGAGRPAISFSPQCGRLFATCFDSLCNLSEGIRAPYCHTADLNWDAIGDASSRWNFPIQCGFLIESGALTLFRTSPWGAWHSSGVLCRDLPEEVIPAMFLSSFVGFAGVRFVKLWNSPPEVCPHCDVIGHGLYDGWRPWQVP